MQQKKSVYLIYWKYPIHKTNFKIFLSKNVWIKRYSHSKFLKTAKNLP